MTSIAALWLPILLSAVIIFIASSIIHMLLPLHKGDFLTLPNEDRVMDSLRALDIPAGEYMAPRPASMQDMKSPEFRARAERGPRFVLSIFPGGPVTMGRELSLWFVYCIVMEIFAAYVASRALAPGAHYLEVFRFAGVATFLGFAGALWQQTVWYRRPVRVSIVATVDALIYAMLAGGTFGWLWPR